jgi:hypothetical protein
VILVGVLYESLKFYKDVLRSQQHQREYMSAASDSPVLPGPRFMCADFMRSVVRLQLSFS